MSGKNKHRNANDYLQYLKGELSRQERHSFEKGLEADPFEQEALEGLETLEIEQAEEDILYLHNRLRKRLSRRRRVAFYSVAATVASLLIVGTVFLKLQNFNPSSDEKQVYTEDFFDPGPPEAEAEEAPAPARESLQKMTEDVPVKELEPSRAVIEGKSEDEPLSPAQEKGQELPEKAPLKEGDPSIAIVEAQDAEPAKAETYDYALEEEQITHMEAEPQAMVSEKSVARSTQKSGRQKKSMARPVAQSPQEVSKAVVIQPDMEEALTGQVSGVVISAEDQGPIPGAIVENRALNSGVITDVEGRFDIAVKEDSPTTLVASFIGMETQEYQVSDGAEVELLMQPDAIALEEVVIVGHVSPRESSPTGATYVVRSDENEAIPEYSVAEPSVGYNAYKKYIEEHIQFPVTDIETDKAVVVLKFKITSQGEISEVSALRSPGELFSEEAISLLKEGPSWNPASNENGPMDDWIRMRIVFKR